MKITKFGHACFIVEQDGESLIVDPGEYSLDLVIPENVVGIVVTHEHADHVSKEILQSIVDRNPQASIFAHQDVIAKLDGLSTQVAEAGDKLAVGNFSLEFFGGQHAIIAKEWPIFANLGVMINGKLYYPGDSFTVPDKNVELLALPISAPWLKISESMDFLRTVRPKFAFPTHDAILSDIGKAMIDRMMSTTAQNVGTTYQRIDDTPLEA